MQVVPSGDHTVTATSGQTKVSGRKTNQTVEKTTRVTSSSLPRVKILPWVKIHPDPGGISNQSWILTLVGLATKLGEISFKNADAYVYTGLMLNAQNSLRYWQKAVFGDQLNGFGKKWRLLICGEEK